MDVITIILIVVACSILGLGFAVAHNNKERLNHFYFLNTLTIVTWAVTMTLYRLSSSDTIEIWTRLLYVSATLIASNFLYFTYIFPTETESISRQKKLLIFSPNILLIVIVLITDWIVSGANVVSGSENHIFWGPLYFIYALYILLYFNVAFYRLFVKFRQTKNRTEKIQIGYVLLGYASSGIVAFTTNLILPWIGYFELNWLGQVSTLLMAGSAAFAIVRHHLFNAKVIATELLTFALWIVLLVRSLVGQNPIDYILLGLTFFVGIFLIRSVIKEVAQREKIEALATDLKKANSRLTELDRQKSEFVSFATHQLRAPLTAMKGYASLVLEGDLGSVTNPVKEAVERIYQSSKTLASIVDDYLNLTRIELGSMKYAFETIDIKELVESVIAEIKPNIDKSGLKFTFESEKGVDFRSTADRDKLKQVIANLIDNSVKYTPKGSVMVTLTLDRPLHKFIFKISDTGVGIPPETLPRLFQKFSRADNANKTNIKGTGLGLFVAKEIIEAHHGTVRAESPGEGKGASFIVELEPFAKA
jgi:signal transduction histidine kinase